MTGRAGGQQCATAGERLFTGLQAYMRAELDRELRRRWPGPDTPPDGFLYLPARIPEAGARLGLGVAVGSHTAYPTAPGVWMVTRPARSRTAPAAPFAPMEAWRLSTSEVADLAFAAAADL